MLREIFDRNNCDKGTIGRTAHHYYKVYDKEFESFREEPIHILEIGIWKGTSHQSWLEYFPNAQVYGIDTFDRVLPKDVPVLKDERMHWIKHNSTRSSVKTAIKREWGDDIAFDVIIDDGDHAPVSNAKTLGNIIEFLKPGGAYYIEDVYPLHIMSNEELFHPYLQRKKETYNMNNMNTLLKAIVPYNPEQFDLRKETDNPDSFIYKLTV